MSTIKNPTNIQIAQELCAMNPNSSYAQALGYNKDTGELAYKDLSLFTSTPDIANEFISDMANKIVVQRAYDLFRGYEMPFKVFMRQMSRLGDVEELLTATLATPEDYADETDAFSATAPTIKLAWIKTEDKKVVTVKLSYEIWAGAFVSETGLSSIAGIILKNLRDSIEEYIRDAIKEDLYDNVNVTATLTSIEDAGETANAQKAYEEIIKLVTDMAIPSTQYNASQVKTFTPMGRAVLVLNSRYSSAFDVNVLASLFNSGAIASKKYFKEVIVTDVDTADTSVVGYILDDEAYLWGNRIDVAQSINNPRTLEINTYYHRWIKRAVVPFRQAVCLTVEIEEVSSSNSSSNE